MIAFAVIAALTLASATLAFTRRNLIHSALLLILTWAGIAAFYLWAGAEFIAFAQILIYVGAVSMIVLFAVLLTRRAPDESVAPASPRRVLMAAIAGGFVFGILAFAIVDTPFAIPASRAPIAEVRKFGFQLMGPHAASLLVVGVILTAALIGGTLIAATKGRDDSPSRPTRATIPEDSAS